MKRLHFYGEQYGWSREQVLALPVTEAVALEKMAYDRHKEQERQQKMAEIKARGAARYR